MAADQPKLFIDTGAMKPLPTYPGRKAAAGAWQKIISEIPKCSVFIDAMCGSGFVGSLVKGCQVVMNDIDSQVIDRIRYTAADIEFRNEHYLQTISRFDNGSPHRVFYFDPPYLFETRSHQKNIYRHEWTNEDHKKFLEKMLTMKCPTMISHYPCKLYDQKLRAWRKITYNSMTRAGVREESLYMNYPQPVLLQCHQHVGENFTDRQRIQRKVKRLMKRLQQEPAQERAAILSSIIDNFGYVISK